MTGSQHTGTTHAADLEQLTAEAIEITPKLNQAQARVAVGLWRLLATGAPAATESLAERLGLPSQEVAATLDGVLAGTYQRDDQSRIIAFWGLALPELPSPHRLEVEGQTLYAWCAPDTIFLPRLLGKPARVHSTLEPTGDPISLVVRPDGIEKVSVDHAVLSFVRPKGKDLGGSVPSILSTFCHHQLFFPSEEAGRRWAQGREDLMFVPLGEETFEAVLGWIEPVLGAALEPR